MSKRLLSCQTWTFSCVWTTPKTRKNTVARCAQLLCTSTILRQSWSKYILWHAHNHPTANIQTLQTFRMSPDGLRLAPTKLLRKVRCPQQSSVEKCEACPKGSDAMAYWRLTWPSTGLLQTLSSQWPLQLASAPALSWVNCRHVMIQESTYSTHTSNTGPVHHIGPQDHHRLDAPASRLAIHISCGGSTHMILSQPATQKECFRWHRSLPGRQS